jgi:hypothetical protein
MMGMELLMKNMLGVDPEEVRAQVQEFMDGIKLKMQQGVESYERIERRLDTLEASLTRIEGILNHVADTVNEDVAYPTMKLPALFYSPADKAPTLEDVDAIHGPVNGGG